MSAWPRRDHWQPRACCSGGRRPGLRETCGLPVAPAEAAALVPRLYALCGQAQGAACAAALRAAAGHDGEAEGLPEVNAGAVVLEALQETLWRLLIDAPRSLSLPPQAAALAPVRAAVAQAIAAVKAPPAESQAALAAAAGALGKIAQEQVYGEAPAAARRTSRRANRRTISRISCPLGRSRPRPPSTPGATPRPRCRHARWRGWRPPRPVSAAATPP